MTVAEATVFLSVSGVIWTGVFGVMWYITSKG